jgi:hypothetical protein
MAQAQQPPKDAPNELSQVIAGALAAVGPYQPKDDPPVPSSGYWDYDESTAKPYWVNYQTTKPLSKATLEFYSLDRDELRRFQELAFQAGYYGTSADREDIPFGSYDPDTYKIWQQYNDRAAQGYKVGKNFTLWDYLQDDVNNRPESLGKDKKAKRQPRVTQLPDPREIEEMVRGVAPSVIGRDADEAFTADFIAMYTKIVSQFQENKYALEGSEEGGTITAPPSAEALAAFRLRTENPEQYEEKRAAARASAYTALLKGAL